jgi:pyruvate dehydrogenase E2 component (dihydrolipoamide acetyltransferase)
MAEVTMPRLSDTMSEGTVGRWLKQPGDQVAVGDIIAEIETDKATMELESFETGTLSKIVIPEGQTVEIGTVIAYIGDAPADSAAAAAPAPAAPEATAPTPEAAPEATAPAAPPVSTNGSADDGRVLASPVARRIAAELGVDLRQVQGTGPGGRIIKENVEEFAAKGEAKPAAPASAPAPTPASAPAPTPASAPAPATKAPAPAATPAPTSAEAEALGRMRKAIARAMTDSKPGVPHIYVTVEVDVDALMALRKQINAGDTKVSVNDLVVKAAANALVTLPAVNTSYALTADGQPGLVRHQQVNVSVAVALDDGLIAPVVKDADTKSVGAISAEIRAMAGRAREGKIKQNELEGATFQVTNLGMFGVVEFGSIITVPQAASLAVGAVRKIPVVRNDEIVIGQVMNLTLSADHRIVDGAVAAQFIREVKALLETPLQLLVR